MTAPLIRHRAVMGGVFGKDGRYRLATVPSVVRGLHCVKYMVIEPATGGVISLADDKLDALSVARSVVSANHALMEQRDAKRQQAPIQGELWPLEPGGRVRRVKPISRRRREVFAKSNGKCFYCGTQLALDGSFQIEHCHPRALGGTDDILNLVASCAPCNLSKGARTSLEFVVQQAAKEKH